MYTSVLRLFLICFFLCHVQATMADTFPTGPVTNNGKKWRIAYVEGGPYSNYQSLLRALTLNLMETGWIEHALIPRSKDESETETLWNFLSTGIKSEYLEFPKDAYWCSGWNDMKRESTRKTVLERLNTPNEIDLLLAFGTWSGQDFANNLHSVPTMVLSTSNAIQAGIIKEVTDSGFDHVHSFIDLKKQERLVRLFYEIMGFKKLGLAYENDLDGRSYAAVDDVEKLSKELGFEIVECLLPITSVNTAEEEKALAVCYEELAPKIDAIYVTDYAGLTKNNLKHLLAPLFDNRVLMFAQTRHDLVKHGILIAAGRTDFKADAIYYRQTMAKILNGASPRSLKQSFDSPLRIVVNIESAKKLGFRVPVEILAGADEIHKTIHPVEE